MNEIVKYDNNTELTVGTEDRSATSRVFYQLLDPSHYTFSYKMDDFTVRMDESDRKSKTTEFVDAKFEEDIPDSDKACYIAAAVSGLITGVLRDAGLADGFEEKVSQFKNKKEWEKYVIMLAGILGYMKSDYDGAVKYIAKRAIQFVGEDSQNSVSEEIRKCLSRLEAHPTLVGLIFSITSQFTEKQYSIDGECNLKEDELPEYYAVGRNYHEKIVYGLLYWIFDLSMNITYAERNILDELNIPKEMARIIKELLETSVMKGVPEDYDKAVTQFSEWLKNLFNNSNIATESRKESFDLEESINVSMKGVYRDVAPIILNECIFRGFYFVNKLSFEIKKKDLHTVKDLTRIPPEAILPFNNRIVSRMSVISSGMYFGINVARNVIEIIRGKKAGGKKLSDILLETIDFAGLGRFIIAVGMDIPYLKEDFKVVLERIMKGQKIEDVDKGYGDASTNDEDNTGYGDQFTLDPLQARIMYSLEAIAVKNDIDRTKDEKDRSLKEEWLEHWKLNIVAGFAKDDTFFITDEEKLYEGILATSKDRENIRWLYLVAAELSLFEPYHPLGTGKDKSFGKLKKEYDYVKDQFVRRQTVVSQEEVDAYVKKYKKYYAMVSGSNVRLAAGVSIAAIAAIASGGAAMAFAPQIAVALAGEAVIGLHGAALTSASLALVGGGSLAAGGLGMAGGTAIITGGGALLGLASSSTVSVANMLMQTDDTFMIRQAAKMLSFCDVVLKGVLNDCDTIRQVYQKTENMITKSQQELKELQDEDNDLDKERIGKLKDYIKCLSRFKDGLEKLLKEEE